MNKVKLSKSKFMAGVQCLKRLYLQVHEPELAAQADGTDEAIIQQGHDVGLLARELFPGGIEVDSSGGLGQAIRATKELVANPEVPAIFEGAFECEGVIVKTDILQRRKGNLWRLVEVKSTADLKEQHLEDVAIQSYALSHSGLNLASIWLAHVNRTYVLTGTTVDPPSVLSPSKSHAQSAKPATRTYVSASITVPCPRHAQGSRSPHGAALHQPGYVRVLLPLQCKRQRKHTLDGFWLSSRCQGQNTSEG